ncbi:hypothetical protein BsWGS_19031 [Bradybaena similaris]
MNRRMLFKIGVTLVLGIGIILFYLVNIQDLENNHEDHKVLKENNQVLDTLDRSKIKDTGHKEDNPLKEASLHQLQHYLVANETTTGAVISNVYINKTSSIHNSSSVKAEPLSNLAGKSKDRSDAAFQETRLDPIIQSPQQPQGRAVHLCVVVCDQRGEETMVMLKSAAMVTHSSIPMVFHIITEPRHHTFFRDQLNLWPKVYRQNIAYRIYTVTFPSSTTSDSWKKLFKPCASQRLFLPDLLKSVDSLIYVDTDTLFFQSLADLWSHFALFNEKQLAGLVSEAEDGTAGWYNRFANHPFYGQFGVNSGVMLMNLTRLRQTSWLSDMQSYYEQYRLMIPWGDQDLINIFFAAHPEQLYLMSCPWNYRSDHCKYMSNCKQAEQHGVSVLHGSRRMFYEDKEPAFAAIYETFSKYRLGDDLEHHFLKVLEETLKACKPSNCGKVSSIFLLQLQKLLERNKELHFLMEQSTDIPEK